MTIIKGDIIDTELAGWNDAMYRKHPTPYRGVAGLVEKTRVQALLRLARIQPDEAVLEIGCEAGHLLVSTPPAKRTVGADISQAALEDASALFRSRNHPVELYQADAQQSLPFARGEFDVILCSEMLEHVADPRSVLCNIHALATPGTRLIVSVPIEAPKLFVKKILRSTGLFRVLFPGIEQEQSEWHLQAFTKRMLYDLCDGLFEIERCKSIYGIHLAARMKPINLPR